MLHEGGDSDNPAEDTKADLVPRKANDADEEAAVVEDPVWKFLN